MNSLKSHHWDLRRDGQQSWSWLKEKLTTLRQHQHQHQHQPLVLVLERTQAEDIGVSQDFQHSLDHGEHDRFFTYRLDADRQRFLLGRGAIRRILGEWTGTPAAEVKLQRGACGKPFCKGGPEFNISHSGELVAIALHPSQPVGVDVETLAKTTDWELLANKFLTSDDIQRIKMLPISDHQAAFLQAWCCHEAALKATGEGLGGSADKFTSIKWTLDLDESHVGATVIWRAQSL